MYVIETQKVLDLKLNLMASYVIIPQTGFYNGTQNILLLDLGHFKVRTCLRKYFKLAKQDPKPSICNWTNFFGFLSSITKAIFMILPLKTNFEYLNLYKPEFCFFRCRVKARKICRSCRRVPATLKTLCPERTTALMCSLAAYSSFTANQVQTMKWKNMFYVFVWACIRTVWSTV